MKCECTLWMSNRRWTSWCRGPYRRSRWSRRGAGVADRWWRWVLRAPHRSRPWRPRWPRCARPPLPRRTAAEAGPTVCGQRWLSLGTEPWTKTNMAKISKKRRYSCTNWVKNNHLRLVLKGCFFHFLCSSLVRHYHYMWMNYKNANLLR